LTRTEAQARSDAGALPYIALFGAQFAVGAAALMARAGLASGFDEWSLSAWRLTVAGGILLAIAAAKRAAAAATPSPLSLNVIVRLLGAGVCLALHFAAWFASLRLMPVAVSTLLVNTSPLWAGLGGVLFLRQRLPTRFWLGLTIAAPGAWLTTTTGHATAHQTSASLPGAAAALVGAAAMAVYMLLMQDLPERIGTRRVITWTYTCAAISLWPVVLAVSGRHALPAEPSGWLAVLGLALVSQLIGHSALNWCLRFFAAGVVTAATLLEPVIAAALARALLGEAVTPLQAAGGAMLLAGVALAVAPRPQAVRGAECQTPSAEC